MGIQHAPADRVEWDLAAAQLDDIALSNRGGPWAIWKDAVLRWHMKAVANARAEAWIPGMAGSQDPMVEEALGRFYRHHMRVTIGHLKSENLELRHRLVVAVACVRFYAGGANDGGEHAQAALVELDPHAAAARGQQGQPHQAAPGRPNSMGVLTLS
jgi:hypothetical protein